MRLIGPKCDQLGPIRAKNIQTTIFGSLGKQEQAKARSSFHLSALESVYIKTQNPVLRRQKEVVSHWDSSSKEC